MYIEFLYFKVYYITYYIIYPLVCCTEDFLPRLLSAKNLFGTHLFAFQSKFSDKLTAKNRYIYRGFLFMYSRKRIYTQCTYIHCMVTR